MSAPVVDQDIFIHKMMRNPDNDENLGNGQEAVNKDKFLKIKEENKIHIRRK